MSKSNLVGQAILTYAGLNGYSMPNSNSPNKVRITFYCNNSSWNERCDSKEIAIEKIMKRFPDAKTVGGIVYKVNDVTVATIS